MAVTRCRNCGILNHLTKNCPNFGPWYPAPGKERSDYLELAQKISDLVAKDLMDEHGEHEDFPPKTERPVRNSTFSSDEPWRKHTCPVCSSTEGQDCLATTSGKVVRPHAKRLALVETPVKID